MGLYFIDKFSFLHFSVGGIWRFLGFDLLSLIILHILFEYLENTKIGMKIINKYITLWPGGKPHSDSLLNSSSDILFSIFGWLFHNYVYTSNVNKPLAIFYFSNILFYWFNNNQVISFLFVSFLASLFYKNYYYYIYILFGFLLGYVVTFFDNKLELYY